MKLAEVSVKRPVFAIMMTAALIVLGAFSYKDLGLDLMPKTDSPNVNVQVQLPGASAEEVETQITKRIEEAVNTISGIDELRANSNQGQGQANITFALERDIESATQDVRDKVATIVSQFPRDAKQPQITKQDPDASPILQFNVYGAAVAEGDHADRRQADQAGARNLEGRRGDPPPGRAQARNPAVVERRSAERLRAERRPGPDRGHAPERRGSGRQLHRRPLRGGAPHDGPHQERRRFQPDRPRVSRRLRHHVRRRGPGAGHGAGNPADQQAERRPVRRPSGPETIGHQYRRSGRPRAREVGSDSSDLAVGSQDQHRQRSVAFHSPIVRRHPASPDSRRTPRQRGGLLLHPEPSRHAHCRPGRADLDHRHLHVHEDLRLHPEQHDDAGAVAGDRHRHRRRDRRAREHLQVRRGEGSQPEGSGGRRHGGNRAGGHGDDAVARRDLRAGRLHDGPDRPLLLQLRHHVGGRDSDLDVRVLHAHAGAVRDVAEEGRREVRSLDDEVRRCLREDGRRLRQDAHLVASSPAGDDGDRRGRRGVGRLPVPDGRQGTGARRRPGRVQYQRPPAQRHELCADRRIHQADRKGHPGVAVPEPRAAAGGQRPEQLQHHDDAARRAEHVTAGHDAPRAHHASQVPGGLAGACDGLRGHRYLGRLDQRRRRR